MSNVEVRNAFNELVDLIPGSKDLPLSEATLRTPNLVIIVSRISGNDDFRNPTTVNVRLTSIERITEGVISGSFNIDSDRTMEGIVYEDGIVPGFDGKSINLSMTPEQKAKSSDTALQLVDFLRTEINQ